MRSVGVLTLMLLACYALPAVASRWTEAEIRALPDYCQARLNTKDAALYNNWRNVIGPDFEHTHHLCYGMIYMNRYYGAKSPQEKKQILQSAHSNLVYVIQRVDRTYPMLPEAYLQLGTALSLQGKDGEALQAMLKAIELDPKLARAYTASANQYVKVKKKEEALKLTTEGLRQIPGNASLQRLYAKLGGQLPYPEPAAPAEQKPLEAASQAMETDTGSRVGHGSESVVPEPNADAVKAGNESPPPEVEEVTLPQVGSPSNPWCRFCPPEPGQ